MLLEETETQIQGLGAIDYSGSKVQTTPQWDKLAESIDRLNSIRNECIEKAYDATIKMKRAIALINSLEDATGRDALTRYYIHGHVWERVAYEMGYTFRGIMKVKARALKEFIAVHIEPVI